MSLTPSKGATTAEKGLGENGESVQLDTEQNEPQPHVHLKTYIAVFAVCMVYLAQNFAIVGAGAVSVSVPQTNFTLKYALSIFGRMH
jgi:hypothetical protein